jgi:hypothetical protein
MRERAEIIKIELTGNYKMGKHTFRISPISKENTASLAECSILGS